MVNGSEEQYTRAGGASAFAAMESIAAGDWDRFLPQLRAAISRRLASDAYKASLAVQLPGQGQLDLDDDDEITR